MSNFLYLIIINTFFDAIFLLSSADDLKKTTFIKIFNECMIVNRNKAYLELQKSQKTNLINAAFNWLIEFMEMVKAQNNNEALSSIV